MPSCRSYTGPLRLGMQVSLTLHLGLDKLNKCSSWEANIAMCRPVSAQETWCQQVHSQAYHHCTAYDSIHLHHGQNLLKSFKPLCLTN